MTDDGSLSSEARARLTGVDSGPGFIRCSYVVHNHSDGTGTIALNQYEMSIGRDLCGFQDFMCVEIGVVRQVVKLLNDQLPARVPAAEVEDWSSVC